MKFIHSIKTAVVLLGLGIVFFYPLFRGHVLFCCDNLLINIPSRSFLFSQLNSGTYPLWNPYIFSGSPFLADINLSPLYPGVFIEYVVSHYSNLFTVLSLSAFMHVLFSFLGMYWCCRLLKMDWWGSLVGAITYAFSGTILTYLHNMPMLQVAAILPWVFGTLVQFVHTRSYIWFILFVFASALQIIAGHPQLTYYSWFLYISYYVVFSNKSILNKLVDSMLMVISVSLLSSIQLLPFIEFATQSTRIGGDYAYATQGSLPLTALVRFIFPSVVGNVRLGTDWWQGGSVYGFVSVTSLLLALSVVRKSKVTAYFAIAGIVSLLAAFGKNLPVYSLLYQLIPGISLFRVPAHFLLLYTICLSLLAGYAIMTMSVKKGKLKYVQLVILCTVICFAGLLLESNIAESMYTFLTAQELFVTKVGYLGLEGITYIVRSIVINCLVLLFIACAFLLCTNTKRKIVIVLGIILELFLYSRMNFVTIDRHSLQVYQNDTASFVNSLSINEGSRVYTNPQLYPSPHTKIFGSYVLDDEIAWQFYTLRPNIGMLYQIKMVNGYASLAYKKYQEYFQTTANDPTGIVIPKSSEKELQFLSTSVILNTTGCIAPCSRMREVTYQKQLPYSRLETPTREIIPVFPKQKTSDYLLFNISSSESGKLVVAETAYPGWQVKINGTLAQLQHENVLSVLVPSGVSQIEFIYAPTSVFVGKMISALIFIVLIVTGGFLRLRNKKIIAGKQNIQKTKQNNY